MGLKNTNLGILFLHFAIGIFFIIFGLAGVVPSVDEIIFSLKSNYSWLEVLFGILEIGAGVVILIGFFTPRYVKLTFYGGLAALFLWGIRIFLTRFAWGFNFVNHGVINVNLFIDWSIKFLTQLLIGIGIFVIMSRND